MDYTAVLTTIQDASLFDLYRLNVAIHNELDNPQRIAKLKNSFDIGEIVSYFDEKLNRLIEGTVIRKNPKYVVIQSLLDNKHWHIPYYLLNLQKTNTDIHVSNTENLSKNNLKMGDSVGFNKDGKIIVGKIIRLNFKSVTLLTPNNYRWRVSYTALFRFVDAEFEKAFDKKLFNLAMLES